MKEKFRVVAIDETADWDAGVLAEYHIEKAFCLYAIREGEATHCCSFTPSSWAIALENVFLFDFDLNPALRPAVIDEHLALCQRQGRANDYILDDIRSLPDDKGMGTEALDDCYLSYIDPKTYDKRFLSAKPDTFTIRARDFKGGSKGREYHDAIWDAAREHFQEGTPDVPILHPETYLAYEAEQRAKLRAENRVPLCTTAHAHEQLALFVAAARRLPEAEVVAAGWFSPWATEWYRRHPEDLAEADKAKGLI